MGQEREPVFRRAHDVEEDEIYPSREHCLAARGGMLGPGDPEPVCRKIGSDRVPD